MANSGNLLAFKNDIRNNDENTYAALRLALNTLSKEGPIFPQKKERILSST